MDRDRQFEIQYLISLIIAVVGSLSAEELSVYVPTGLAQLFLLLVFIHLVAFNVVYTVRRATGFELSEIDVLAQGTRWTLYGITGLFFYLLTSVLFTWLLLEVLPFSVGDIVFRISLPMLTYSIDLSHRILFGYVGPLFVIGVMSVLGWRKFMASLLKAKAVDISVVPVELSVFHNFESTRPLHINIENNNPEEISFETRIEFPDEIDWKYRGTREGSGTLSEETAVPASGHEPYDIELQYQGTERKTREVDVTITMDGDTYSETVTLTLEEH